MRISRPANLALDPLSPPDMIADITPIFRALRARYINEDNFYEELGLNVAGSITNIIDAPTASKYVRGRLINSPELDVVYEYYIKMADALNNEEHILRSVNFLQTMTKDDFKVSAVAGYGSDSVNITREYVEPQTPRSIHARRLDARTGRVRDLPRGVSRATDFLVEIPLGYDLERYSVSGGRNTNAENASNKATIDWEVTLGEITDSYVTFVVDTYSSEDPLGTEEQFTLDLKVDCLFRRKV